MDVACVEMLDVKLGDVLVLDLAVSEPAEAVGLAEMVESSDANN